MELHAFLTFINTFKRTEKSGALFILVQAVAVTTRVSYVTFTQRVLQSGRCCCHVFPRWLGVLMVKQHIADSGVCFPGLVDRYVLNQTKAWNWQQVSRTPVTHTLHFNISTKLCPVRKPVLFSCLQSAGRQLNSTSKQQYTMKSCVY